MTDFINKSVGALVDVEDDIMLEKEISKILKEERVFGRAELANYAKERYSEEKVIQNLIELYENVIKVK